MRIYRHYNGLPTDAQGAVVVPGNFDGVHRGHQTILATARARADALGRPLAVLTFEPHPRSYFRAADPPFRLTPFRTKARYLEALGVDLLYVLHFDAALARLTADEFFDAVLAAGFGAAHLIVGYDFRFGRGRTGDAEFLRQRATAAALGIDVIEPVRDVAEEIYSSSLIRQHLRDGAPARAAALCGHFWEIEGHVLPGDRRGRTIGFPTANLALGEYMRPALGVYAVRAAIAPAADADWRDGVANIGVRPTVDGETLLLEVHLFDFDGDIYGQLMRVALVEFLRAERKFDGIDALTAQIAADSHEARQLLAARALEPGAIIAASSSG